MRFDAMKEKYEVVTVRDHPMLFTCLRIRSNCELANG